MKTKLLVSTVSAFCSLQSAFGQGALTPPDPPAPTMKTLAQVEPRTPISFLPFNITNSGSFYLTTNLTGSGGINGVTITASNVTVDLEGFALIGNGGSRCINVPNAARNISVRNGTIQNWAIPVFAFAAINSRFEQLQLSDNGGALNVGSNCVVNACEFQNNSLGVYADNGSTVADCALVGTFNGAIFTADEVTFRHCAVRGSGAYGITSGNRCVIQDCTITSNANNGIIIGSGSSLLNCAVMNNSLTGIVASASCVIRDCLAQNNQQTGISVGDGSSVSGCSALYNGGGGIYASNSCLIKSCTVVSNYGQGISCMDNNTVTGCLIATNGSNGIQVNNDNLITDNNCFANGVGILAGIFVTGFGNRIEGNTATGNSSRGIEVTSNGNLILRNSARTNTYQNVNFDIAPGNFVATIVSDPTLLNAPTNNANINISF